MTVLRQTRTDAMLIGTYPDDGPHVTAAGTEVLAHPPTLRPGTYAYGDDGRRSCLLLACSGPAGAVVSAAVLCDHSYLDAEGTRIEVVSAPGPTAAQVGVATRLSRWRFDLARAHWVCGELDDYGYPPSPYLHQGVYAVGYGPSGTDLVVATSWHPELRRLALERGSDEPVRLWRVARRHSLPFGIALTAALRRALGAS